MAPENKSTLIPKPLAEETLLPATRYRAGMHAELQKFGDISKGRQMLLSEAIDEELALDAAIEVTGLDLSVTEAKALSALQILLDKTDYKGNLPGREADSESYKWRGTLPRLAITPSEYFEAYGLDAIDGRYQGKQRLDALQALDSLTGPRRILYERKRWEGQGKRRREVSDIIDVKAPLISMAKGYKGLDQEQASQVREGKEVPQRATKIVVEFGPLLVDGIDNYFLLKPTALHQEIKAVLGSKRVSRAVSLFIEWLLTKNLPEMSIGKELLAKRLRLDYLIEQRKQRLLEKRLQQAIQTALELGYLLDYEEDALGVYRFRLNPERMGRPPKWKLKAGDEEDYEEDSSQSL